MKILEMECYFGFVLLAINQHFSPLEGFYARKPVLPLHCIENDKPTINEVPVGLDTEEGIYFILVFITLNG